MGKISDMDERVKKLEEAKLKVNEEEYDPQKQKDKTRSTIALIFTWGFFVLVTLIIIGVPIYNLFAEHTLDMKDTLLLLSSIVGGPFGFVLGYYFKGKEDS